MWSVALHRILKNIAKNRIFTTFDPLTHGKLQDSAIKILCQWTVNLMKVIISNFYIDISFRFFFYNVKKDCHNLTNSSHFLCNFCTFDYFPSIYIWKSVYTLYFFLNKVYYCIIVLHSELLNLYNLISWNINNII